MIPVLTIPGRPTCVSPMTATERNAEGHRESASASSSRYDLDPGRSGARCRTRNTASARRSSPGCSSRGRGGPRGDARDRGGCRGGVARVDDGTRRAAFPTRRVAAWRLRLRGVAPSSEGEGRRRAPSPPERGRLIRPRAAVSVDAAASDGRARDDRGGGAGERRRDRGHPPDGVVAARGSGALKPTQASASVDMRAGEARGRARREPPRACARGGGGAWRARTDGRREARGGKRGGSRSRAFSSRGRAGGRGGRDRARNAGATRGCARGRDARIGGGAARGGRCEEKEEARGKQGERTR